MHVHCTAYPALMDARAQSAVSDLQAATDALTMSRQRYLGRLSEPRFATVPGLLRQLADAVERSGEVGAVTSSTGSKVPLDLDPVDLLREIQRGVRGRVLLAGLRPRPDPDPVLAAGGDLRQLAAHARTIARTDYPTVESLANDVCDWRGRVEQLLPEDKTSRELPDLTCQRCHRKRIPERQRDGRVLLLPALLFVKTPMPGITCRGCGHLYQGDRALRALAAWQGSGRAGAVA